MRLRDIVKEGFQPAIYDTMYFNQPAKVEYQINPAEPDVGFEEPYVEIIRILVQRDDGTWSNMTNRVEDKFLDQIVHEILN